MRSLPSIDQLYEGILEQNRGVLARAITLIESTRSDHRPLADALLNRIMPHSGQSLRIGVSGVPGAGKSCFIEALGCFLIERGHRIAVLAIDPSSSISGGSLLGDKTRMEALSVSPQAFVRPSPSGGLLGGVAAKTREIMFLCEAAGYDVILIETVGVGQSETTVASMVDVFLALMLPNAGDELQGIKRGLLERVDMVVVNKRDGDLITLADQARLTYQAALHLSRSTEVPVFACSALERQGLGPIWDALCAFRRNATFQSKRQLQNCIWMQNLLEQRLREAFLHDPDVQQLRPKLEAEVTQGTRSPASAAQQLIDVFLKITHSSAS